MGDVVVLEAAQHMRDGVDLADIGEELVAQPFALRRAAHQAGDITKVMRVGISSADLPMRARVSSRGSGTATSPTLGSMVQNG